MKGSANVLCLFIQLNIQLLKGKKSHLINLHTVHSANGVATISPDKTQKL